LSQAEAAERKGNIAEARRLYQQLARLTTDHELSVKCINRDHYLAEGHTGSVPPGYQPGVPSTSTYPPQAGTMPPGYPAAQPIAPRPATSVYTYVPAMPGSRPTQAFTASYIRPPQQPNAAVTQ